ncbi:hypothetical protein [Bifidobacterium miconisargentati]|uniref:hypothetical protein n=1 Tax=Bifidobacterium miconisargentati TaxID=2834437 RepID=UPI001BDCAC1D|nr:hypothetical protein [Bifidobacterium miconisargentati]MBW3090022.1 hypothetical protein [Bifidobacterium miconisargentati]
MNQQDIWAPTGDAVMDGKMADALDYLHVAHNGGADIEAFVRSEYGQEHGRLVRLGFEFEEDPTGEAVRAYYDGLGLDRVMFENEDYYRRWILITPKELASEAAKGRRYPLVFAHHGGSVPVPNDEFACGMPQIAADERIMVAMLQDTNWGNVRRVLDRIEELYPVDRERVYLMGESQGGYEVTSALFRMPERITAVAPCGNDIWRDWDNFNIRFTDGEYRRLKETFVPVMQVVGQYEASNFAPVNDWAPRKDWGRPAASAHTYRDPRRDDQRDPTRIVGGHRAFSDQPAPPEGADRHEWMIERLNRRMDSLGCTPRDPATCISYLTEPDSELHRVVGFYGDEERVREYYGYKHWMVDIRNSDGMDAFRYVVAENAPHCWPVMAGRLAWEFFRQFRRDERTGLIVMDEYRA